MDIFNNTNNSIWQYSCFVHVCMIKTITYFLIVIIVVLAFYGYLMYGVLYEYDINLDLGTYLDEHWTDTQKRPYNLHGLDD